MRTRWRWWLLGTLIGLVPALPWVMDMRGASVSRPVWPTLMTLFIRAFVCVVYSSTLTLGIESNRGLGLQIDERAFINSPILADGPSYLVYGLHRLILWTAVATVPILLLWRYAWRPQRRLLSSSPPVAVPTYRLARFYALAAVLIPIVLYIMTIDMYFYHYFYIFMIFSCVYVASIALPWRPLLLALVVGQGLITALFLVYVHEHGGTRWGEFGVTYSQLRKEQGRAAVPRHWSGSPSLPDSPR